MSGTWRRSRIAVAAQAAGSARSATGIVAGMLGLAYLLRAAGDTASAGGPMAALSWISPIGWTEQVRPFGPLALVGACRRSGVHRRRGRIRAFAAA